jgi:hypothetical protein
MAEKAVTHDTPIRLTIGKMTAVFCAVVMFTASATGAWYSTQAAASMNVDRKIQAHDLVVDKKLEAYPTWSDIRAMREDDFRYWDSRLDELKDLIAKETRR